MDQDVGSPESTQMQSGSTTYEPIENLPVYFGNEGVRAQASSPLNHDLVQKALELASVSPYKINRQSRNYSMQIPEDVYDREYKGAILENLKYTLLKPVKDHFRFDNAHEANSIEPKTNKYAKFNHDHVRNVSKASSTPENVDVCIPLAATSLPTTALHSFNSGIPMVITSNQDSMSMIRRVPVTSAFQSELKFSRTELELRPISIFQRLTRKTSQSVSESYNSISDPSEESLVSLIDSVNEYSESQTRCLSDLSPSETSPIKHCSYDLLATSMSPQSTTDGQSTTKTTPERLRLQKGIDCRVCNKRVSILSLKIHMEKHSRENQLREPRTILDQTGKSDSKVKSKVNHQPKRYVCPICRKRFTRSNYLRIHARIHTGETPFSCSVCNKKFSYKRSLIEHVADHKQIKLYHCDICDKEYSRQSGFDAHRRNHKQRGEAVPNSDIVATNKKPVSNLNTTVLLDTENDVPVADKVSAALVSQILYSKQGRDFTCSICEKTFTKEHLMRTHIKSHETDDDQSYTCALCAEKLLSVNALKTHIVQHAVDIYKTSFRTESVQDLNTGSVTTSVSDHVVEEINTSANAYSSNPNSSSESKTVDSLNENVKPIKSSNRIRNRKSHPTKKLVSKDYNLDCDADDVEALSTGALSDDDFFINHENEDGNLLCTECGKVLKSEKQLALHLKTHQPSKFICQECGRDYKTQHNFQKHLTWHETNQLVKAKRDRKAECEICAKSVRVDCMKNHIRTHTGERPFQCDYCGATFKQATHLKTHIKIHTGEKPHQCIYCGQVFRKTGNLVVHVRNHTGEKPYKCGVCSESFKHLAIYKEHLASHRGISLYQCEFCGHKYKSRSGYDCHKRRNHKKDAIFKCYSCGVIFNTSQEVMACPCTEDTSRNKSTTDAPSERTAVNEEIVISDTIALPQTLAPPLTISHSDAPMSLVYSSMMGILNQSAQNENETILPPFQHKN